MSNQPPTYAMYSSSVRLVLKIRDTFVELSSIGPDQVTPRIPVELESGDAEIIMQVDDEAFTWPVHLPDGAVPFEDMIRATTSGPVRRQKMTDGATTT